MLTARDASKRDDADSVFVYVFSESAVVWLISRLRAGRDQTHHLPRGTQDRRPGRGHHRHCAEGRAGRPGVPPQERTDPQVCSQINIRFFFFFTRP